MNKADGQEVDNLKQELLGLFSHIQKMRKEIAAIRRPGVGDDSDKFSQMSDELDAIVQATETATDTIMENAEKITSAASGALPLLDGNPSRAAIATIPDLTSAIFEACAFQDITGQRITKVIRLLQFIEERVNALISIWGEEQIAKLVAADKETENDEYKKFLHGPQMTGKGVSQADVDALFGPTGGTTTAAADEEPAALGQNDIDKLFG